MGPLNSQYNKAIYGGVAAAITTILAFIAQQYGVELSAELQTAITTLITAAVVYAVPNKSPAATPPPPAIHPDDYSG